MDKNIYLEQISQYIGNKLNKKQQILMLDKYSKPVYAIVDSENQSYCYMPMIVICDANINVKYVVWHSEYGLGLNPRNHSMKEIHKNNNKVHTILWNTGCEVGQDSVGIFVNYEGALNGILVIDEDLVDKHTLNKMLEYPIFTNYIKPGRNKRFKHMRWFW